MRKVLVWMLGLAAAGVLGVAMLVAVALAMAYPQLPDVSEMRDYKPKLSMRIFSADGKQIGEFGEERRNFIPFKDIPQVMKNAVLSIEDARFYQHGGVDYIGLLRASLANLGRAKSQGASTITMQVARNFFLSSERTWTRKIYEALLSYRGFFAPEEANDFLTLDNLVAQGGRLPLNTSGGNLAECYMHGLELITEAVKQIRGTSPNQLKKQVNISMITSGPTMRLFSQVSGRLGSRVATCLVAALKRSAIGLAGSW